MKVLFLGSSDFSIGVLEELLKSKHKVVAVICQPDRPSGRGHKLVAPEIKAYAANLGIPVLQYEKVNKNLDEIFALDFDIFVTASFGQIISRTFLSKKIGLNVHPSKLPKYRGATPLQYALMNGDKETSVSIQKMEYEVDSGDIILCEDTKIEDEDTFSTLSKRTAKIGGELLVKALDLIASGEVKYYPQDNSKATYTKMIQKEDGLLDFNNDAESIVNKVRAIGENPGCYFYVGEDRIKVGKLSICRELELKIGEIKIINKQFLIGTNNGCINVLRCQNSNGKMLDAKDFLNGYKFKEYKVNTCC